MSSMFGAIFILLFGVVVFTAQWAGLSALAKGGRNSSWWCMAFGAALSILGAILSAAFQIWIRGMGGTVMMDRMTMYGGVVAGFAGLGTLFFMIGFATHGMKSKRILNRVEELESLIAAQGEQLNRQNPGEPS